MAVVVTGLIAIAGFSSIVHFLTGHGGRLGRTSPRGYGTGPYGG
jgi:hypothetical protein